MPVLAREIFVYPEALFEEPEAQKPVSGTWWVLHTKPRAEKALARRLLRWNIAFFLPLFEKCRRIGATIRSVHLPLFPGYLFLCGDTDARITAFETDLVAQSLHVPDEKTLRQQLARVHRMMLANEPLHPEHHIGPGSLVEIVDGPLAGLSGKVIRRGKKLRFVVEVDLVQRGVSIELERWMFQPAA